MPKLPAELTRKLGPLPRWGWAVGALILFIVWRRYHVPAAAAAAPSAVVADQSGGSFAVPQGTSGGGNAVDNLSGPLLEALGAGGFGTKDSYNTNTSDYVYSPSTSIDYGSGNSFPPAGGTASGVEVMASPTSTAIYENGRPSVVVVGGVKYNADQNGHLTRAPGY